MGTNKEESAKQYVERVIHTVKERSPNEPEFYQAVEEIAYSLVPVFEKHPHYIKHAVLERMTEPDRMITFRVAWMDDEGVIHVNRGYRVQFNNAIGPYKGGLRFDPSVNASIIKFLGFEQIFKNSLTGQAIGAGKGGADFNPKGKSDMEIMRFTQSYMNELSKYIGPNVDVPAGDIGVGGREIDYMVGQYKRLRGAFEKGAFTGKGIDVGGSWMRQESTGYGTVYFAKRMLEDQDKSLEGQRVIVSGAGKVSIYAMEKAIELGAKVIACSDSSGYIFDEAGLDVEKIKQLKEVENKRISEYTKFNSNTTFDNEESIWTIPCDVALPCATQNELDENNARALIENGVSVIAEGANMPCTHDAILAFQESDVAFGPGKAANAGGVAVSALEMAQNSSRVSWSFEAIDQMLQDIMTDIYDKSKNAAQEYGQEGNLIAGANIAGFKKVADVMIAQGII
ncbi:glutamate dehydrogenase (NADP+) [Alkalihalobacillus xiaoxiensis]|uniref:Glutamate dehydrogenase n=1 Tax=Shouchella xiaoxiensis TaxID=766895 RepID=A0ABS2T0T8_9BACI|nr:NADP-specific glutamate dehydrogenase [Shouchella xiaoxiensis]MBM7840102.1 glutamate dehydrogenase (NADP+) [Shouchella xiaoxiensis]